MASQEKLSAKDARRALQRWREFSDTLEGWALATHARYPLRLMMRASAETWAEPTAWHTWSVARSGALLQIAPLGALHDRVFARMLAHITTAKPRAADMPRIMAVAEALLVRSSGDEAKDLTHTVLHLAKLLSPKSARAILRGMSAQAQQQLIAHAEDPRDLAAFDSGAIATAMADHTATLSPRNRKDGAALLREVVERMESFHDPAVVLAMGRSLLANRSLASELEKLERAVFAQANDNVANARELSPSVVLYNLGTELHRTKKLAAAASVLELALAFPHPIDWAYNNLALTYLRAGRLDDGAKLASLPAIRSRIGPELPAIFHNTACIFAALGRTSDALLHVELAVKHGCPSASRMPKDRDLAILHAEPRFIALFAGSQRSKVRLTRKA